MSVPTDHQAAATAIRPFQVSVPDQDLVELRRRIDATRWPDPETVDLIVTAMVVPVLCCHGTWPGRLQQIPA